MVAVITCRYNIAEYQRPEANFALFKASIQRQAELFVIELAYNQRPFRIPDATSRLRTASVLWHKENLLNLLVKSLPQKYTTIAWVDADVLLSDQKWPAKTEKLLEKYRVVQLCSLVNQTRENGQLLKQEASIAQRLALADFKLDPGLKGHPGMGWAVRRDFFDKVGLFEYLPVGGGDEANFYSFIGIMPWFIFVSASQSLLGKLTQHVKQAFQYTGGRVGFVSQTATHLWHGSLANRHYLQRQAILSDIDADNDIQPRQDGLLEWSDSASPLLRQRILDYFYSRTEDAHDHDY